MYSLSLTQTNAHTCTGLRLVYSPHETSRLWHHPRINKSAQADRGATSMAIRTFLFFRSLELLDRTPRFLWAVSVSCGSNKSTAKLKWTVQKDVWIAPCVILNVFSYHKLISLFFFNVYFCFVISLFSVPPTCVQLGKKHAVNGQTGNEEKVQTKCFAVTSCLFLRCCRAKFLSIISSSGTIFNIKTS